MPSKKVKSERGQWDRVARSIPVPPEWDASLLQGYPPPTELYICQHTQSHTAVTLAWAQA